MPWLAEMASKSRVSFLSRSDQASGGWSSSVQTGRSAGDRAGCGAQPMRYDRIYLLVYLVLIGIVRWLAGVIIR
jgi:hypothetical protein